MNITLESHLKEISEEEGNKLYSNWMVIKEELCNKLETVSSYFQHFSIHNSTHSKEICNNVERFLGPDRIEKLSPTDTWLLLMAFYSHDVGMALKYEDIVNTFEKQKFKEELKKLINENNVELKEAAERVLVFEKENEKLKPVQGKALDIFRDVQMIIEEHYRKGHATRSAKYIGAFLDEKYSIINSRIIELLKKICIAHQEDIENIKQLHYEENGLFQDYVHPRFVAGMLCLGDLLDMDTNRFSKYGLESASSLSYESNLHLEKHRALKHFLIKPSGIEIEIDSPSMEVHRVAREWVQWIDETVDYLILKWSCIAPNNFGNPPKITYKKLLIKGSDLFNEYADLKFTIDRIKVFELLQGANIYEDKFVCIREVIQNAVDSSLIQLWKDVNIVKEKKFENKCNSKITAIIKFWETLQVDNEEIALENLKKFGAYPINVSIYIDDETERVAIDVSDKGTGISKKDLENMAIIGSKKDKITDKDIMESMPGWLKPSGQFGLGLQSIFLISDKFEMITKYNDEPGKKIIFESGRNNKGYITVEACDKNERGTTVRIYIDESKIEETDINIDKLSIKLKPKNKWIMDFIINKAKNNQFIGEKNLYVKEISKIDMKNYFNISINKFGKSNLFDNKENIITGNRLFPSDNNVKYLLENGELTFPIIDSKEKFVFTYFEHKSKCMCKIEFMEPTIKSQKDGDEIVQELLLYNSIGYLNGGAIYFKNVFVCNVNQVIYDKLKYVFQYFKLSLNILDNKADEFLEINRNAIKGNYRGQFLDTLMKILKKAFLALHDNLIENKLSSKYEYLIIIYQLIKFFKIETERFTELYKEKMEGYLYEEIFAQDKCSVFDESCDLKERNRTFSELLNDNIKSLYLIKDEGYDEDIQIEKKYLDLIDKNVIEEVKMEDGIQQEGYYMNVGFCGDKLISYEYISSTIVKFQNDFYYLKELKPLVIKQIREYDEISLISAFIEVSKNKKREMIAMKIFENLVIENIDKERIEYVIKLPFNDKHYEKVINSIKYKSESFDNKAFKGDVINTEYFAYLVEYVSDKTNLCNAIIKESYCVLIDRYLDLLINTVKEKNGPYTDFVRALVFSEEKESIFSYTRG
ncbi:HD domain-containing protein [Clostridium estertheticum]|uniref:HD-CE domain-containing protein n=1 Tax=Clostridium estertheticum TaxID=238834 RepID=A0A7Y3SYW4_9CLOT|nr:ATP-binding protein [Clostridium estertheticum]NNU77568.1 hypothetical protein [Clostridium estertheticum]WBL48489.1 ATP-binding protein [Clostridium estertheticum]